MYKEKTALRGSVTVFASLSLLLVASFLLTLLEAARVKGLDAYSRMQRTNATESVFSEYNRDLFEWYGIFLLDGSYGSGELQLSQINGRMLAVSQQNLRPAIPMQVWRNVQNFYQMDVADASVTGYLLATDKNGAPFRSMVAASMKARYPLELAQKLYDGLLSAEQAMDEAQAGQSAMDHAQENIQKAQEEQAQAATDATDGTEGTSAPVPVSSSVENPMDVVKALKEADILTLVMPPGSAVSAKTIDGRGRLEHRTLLQGNEPWEETGGWYEDVLYQQFLQTQFACYEAGRSGTGALDYELEYIQAGKDSDRENLKYVVNQLLLLREGANFIYLQTDAVKKEEAYAVATALATSLGIVPATALIAQGILAAWAYAESILDVRTLLSGGKIAWMKTAESWSSSLSGIGGLLAGSARAQEQPGGESYRDYLEKLLYLKSERALNYRAMDLMELRARMNGRETLRMDAMILALRTDFSYEAEPLFSGMVTIKKLPTDRFVFSGSEYYSYVSND